MTGDFTPEKYADERRKKIIKLLRKKLKKRPQSRLLRRGGRGGRSGRSDRGARGEHAQGEKEPVSRRVTEVAGKRLSLSNLEKDLYPSYGFTKAHILEYYRRISWFILPHLKDRALTLKRYPEEWSRNSFSRSAVLLIVRPG